jgi:urease accessory protein UreF
MYTKEVAQLDQLVNQHTIRGVLGLLASLATEKANQCLQSATLWKADGCLALKAEDEQAGLQWVQLGRDLIALARKTNEHQLV